MGYLPDPDKPLFIVNTHNQEEVSRQEVEVKSLEMKFVSGSRYLGVYMGFRKEF